MGRSLGTQKVEAAKISRQSANGGGKSTMLISMLKYIKIFKGTPTCFDLNRSSSGSSPVPR